MLRYTSIVLVLAACGCASTQPHLTLAHNIEIPKQCRAGSDNPAFPDFGVAERYVSAYDRGWWIAVQRYAKDINFDDPSPLAMSGWREEAYGGGVGYVAARDRIEELIRTFGKQKVFEYLQPFRSPDEQ